MGTSQPAAASPTPDEMYRGKDRNGIENTVERFGTRVVHRIPNAKFGRVLRNVVRDTEEHATDTFWECVDLDRDPPNPKPDEFATGMDSNGSPFTVARYGTTIVTVVDGGEDDTQFGDEPEAHAEFWGTVNVITMEDDHVDPELTPAGIAPDGLGSPRCDYNGNHVRDCDCGSPEGD
jgi:hypothetical protein